MIAPMTSVQDDMFGAEVGEAIHASTLDAYEPIGIATGIPQTGRADIDRVMVVVVIKGQRILDGRRHDVMFLCGLRALVQLTNGLALGMSELMDRGTYGDEDHDTDTGEDDSGDDQPDEDTPKTDPAPAEDQPQGGES